MAGTTSLLRSAASTRATLADYQDRVAAYEYSNSAYTDSAYNSYSKYLEGRVAELNSAGGVSNASKALSLAESLRSATKQNMSATIQRENIQILAGNSTLTDKYNLISQQFVKAQAIGDDTLAQQLMSQAYSLNQSIQYQAQQAQAAKATLENSNLSALQEGLKSLNATLKGAGQKEFNATVGDWVNSNKSALAQLGVVIPKGAQPNYWDLVNGVMGAEYNHYIALATALAPTDPAGSYAAQLKAQALMNGGNSVSTLGGNLTAQQVQEAAANPSMFAYNETTGKYEITQKTGFQYATDANGKPTNTVIPTYSGSRTQMVFLNPTQLNQLKQLGLEITGDSGSAKGKVANGVQVQATNATPSWLRDQLNGNGLTNVYVTDKGLEFEADTDSGKGVYTVTTDDRGLMGLYETAPDGSYKALGGQYGFNERMNTFTNPVSVTANPSLPNLQLGGPTNASDLLSNATSTFSLPPIAVAPVANVPRLSINAPAPATHLSVAPPAFHAVVPHTVSPQPAVKGTTIQNAPGGMTLQGGSINLQGGGGFYGGLQ